jgi:hypothetical protein
MGGEKGLKSTYFLKVFEVNFNGNFPQTQIV